jgi:peptide subunit release factor 1 (eRF1)
MLSSVRYQLTKVRMLHLLQELKADSINVASLCLPAKSDKGSIRGMMETILDVKSMPEDIAQTAAESPTGAMLFWGAHHRYLILPPFPLKKERVSRICEIEPLDTLLHQEYLIGLVLVRLGAYGIGVFQGEKLISSKVGTGLVHARHRQGGSSSHRFERHRYKQMETFFTRVCLHAREQLEPQSKKLDYLLYGGTRETIMEFRKQCHFMHEFDKNTLELLLNIREPKQTGLEEGIQEAWSSRVIQWDER